ncbi:cytochrome P450 [Aspergillus bertholletiae]|uniref:Cytochrome P450 n=1 Tax=Aspergillus bertholletiae TaxID=1226010 RepID=A0A5N7BF41_9EURO|nr:cytochrome P450 [Aspergillus bertholletiae]
MALLKNFTIADWALALGVFTITYTLWLVIYRLWLSPIAGFPGAFWPKVTFWYEFYYEWVQPGQYYRRINDMHKEYGPIIRVSPDEIHILDPSFYDELYAPHKARRANAYNRYAQGTGFEDLFALMAPHEAHKYLRDSAEKLYSKVAAHEALVMDCVKSFCGRLDHERDANEPLNISHACLSLSIDVITATTFQHPSDYLKHPDFNKELLEIQRSGLVYVPLFAHLPWMARLFSSPLIEYLSSRVPKLREWDEVIQQNGIHHTAHTMENVITYLAMDKRRLKSLKDELAVFWQEHPDQTSSWFALRKLPYLTACIYEGLRMGASGMKRAPRVFPDDAIRYGEWVIPKETPISMTIYYMHMDPIAFPDPEKFDPERWLNADPDGLMLSQFVPFGRGPRDCVGKNIAWMQLYFALSQLYRPGGPDIELFESDDTDVRLVHGYVFPQPRLDSPGVRVLIHNHPRRQDEEDTMTNSV